MFLHHVNVICNVKFAVLRERVTGFQQQVCRFLQSQFKRDGGGNRCSFARFIAEIVAVNKMLVNIFADVGRIRNEIKRVSSYSFI